ncbi:uncharacterized protein LOC119563220 isoform X3 [Drosophila subpulchrella]|uniref:uncharacterized protein LOC119563220 isoform X3 n=1 Tax=Drosophila subpulchrella TaxID=1486046 RepID=UPI0018A14196|nr:uncharacterized protein LOC119563220 isoform X3 [Drosophila subpulchrella]
MIVETIQSPSALRLHYFNHHLANVENILRRIETYSLELNNHICGTKKLVATNQNLIARLKKNDQTMKTLLEDKDQEKQVGQCHLRKTCKVTNIREICWTQCKSHNTTQKEEKTQDWAEIRRKSHTLLSSLKKDFERQKGGQELRDETIPMFDRNEEIIFKVKCIFKLVEKLDFKTARIADVKAVCRRVLSGMFTRQKPCCQHKVVKSHITLIYPENPYLST